MGKKISKLYIKKILDNRKNESVFSLGEFVFYQEQFFSRPILVDDNLPKPDIDQIYFDEWNTVVHDLNMRRKNEKIRYLENELKLYIENDENIERDFLNHIRSMFKNYPESLDDDTNQVVRHWIYSHLTMIGQNIRQETTPKFSPIKFAKSNWPDIVILIRQHDGNVMGAIKSFCAHNKSDKEIRNITRAVSRLCESRGVEHQKNKS